MLRLPWQAGRRQLRVFAVVAGVLLLALAARRWHAATGTSSPTLGAGGLSILGAAGVAILGAAGLAILVLGIVDPLRIRGLYLLWLVAIAPIAWVLSYVLLGILYFLVITPIGLLLRLLGRDALALRRPPSRQTFWYSRRHPPRGFDSYRRQA